MHRTPSARALPPPPHPPTSPHAPSSRVARKVDQLLSHVASPWVKAANSLSEALESGGATGLYAELGVQPSAPGVEPFLRALQAAAPSSADETAEQNETTDAKEEDKMEE